MHHFTVCLVSVHACSAFQQTFLWESAGCAKSCLSLVNNRWLHKWITSFIVCAPKKQEKKKGKKRTTRNIILIADCPGLGPLNSPLLFTLSVMYYWRCAELKKSENRTQLLINSYNLLRLSWNSKYSKCSISNVKLFVILLWDPCEDALCLGSCGSYTCIVDPNEEYVRNAIPRYNCMKAECSASWL